MKCSRCLLRLLGQSARSLEGIQLHLASTRVRQTPQNQVMRKFHLSSVCPKGRPWPEDFPDEVKKDKSLVVLDDLFEQVTGSNKTKASFNKVIEVFNKRDVRRRGHVEFIYAALKKMPEYGVERDLAVYNKLLDVFPKEVFVPTNFIQRMFYHYPRQQECGVEVLEQMETYGVTPNVETKVLLHQIFGPKGQPVRKYQRIMYWFPKFKHANPFVLPAELPVDPVALARLSLTRIADDRDAKVTVYQIPCTDITESGEEVTLPHIVGIQSPDQMELLAKHNPNRPVFVEGPFPLWLRNTLVHYYVLRAEPTPPEEMVEEVYDPERCFDYPLQLDLDYDRDLGDMEDFDVDDLDEGPIFSMCMTGQGDESTLNQWISGLQETNPILGQIPTLFRLNSGPRELQGATDSDQKQQQQQQQQRSHRESVTAEERTEEAETVAEEEEQQRKQQMKQ
ncbi:evolutionarily conserved signaling intermediate in Toll pathway, mitochondrial [Neosynchiropus ocellatus]